MRYLSSFEQARLYWYFRWSQGEIARIASGFQSVFASQMNALLVPPEPSAAFNDVMHVHPTRSSAADWTANQDNAIQAVDDERNIRRALERLAREEQEQLVLAFVVGVLPTRDGFGIFGNLAEHTTAANKAYKARRRRLPITLYLNRLSKRARGKSVATWEGQFCAQIMIQCDSMALTISRKYKLALEGLDGS